MFIVIAAFCVFGSSLDRAQRLRPPTPTATANGEDEGDEFWRANKQLLKEAHKEWGRYHEALYDLGIDNYVKHEIRTAVEAGDEKALHAILHETSVEGVYSAKIFTESFFKNFSEELDNIQSSGIPTRRPNGMNRFGVIAEDIGLKQAFEFLREKYLAPIAMLLFQEYISRPDTRQEYTFVIRYRLGDDTQLSRHADASSLTFNTCIGETFTGGNISFSGPHGVGVLPSTVGVTLIHRGMHKHAALQLESGTRTNLVTWLSGEDGYVRVAPYPSDEQSTASDRWSQKDNEL
eukprot:TRINITY_DN6914_c0_g1_i1.p1 TRINITY_DN6914_c0_g1~~TRINITY_DN6914_c0_g1_i1.p1  ORF type:complete len:291 (+),score=7.59 TRINITY_DN6914_c0_g1_i1:92-964(+)